MACWRPSPIASITRPKPSAKWCATSWPRSTAPGWRECAGPKAATTTGRPRVVTFAPAHDGRVSDVIHGHCDPRFDALRTALAEEIGRGEELGAAIAVRI